MPRTTTAIAALLAAASLLPACGGGPEPRLVELCDNDRDDDGDFKVDCADPECSFICEHPGAERCDDGIDNDGDGRADCADREGCPAASACSPDLVCGADGRCACLPAPRLCDGRCGAFSDPCTGREAACGACDGGAWDAGGWDGGDADGGGGDGGDADGGEQDAGPQGDGGGWDGGDGGEEDAGCTPRSDPCAGLSCGAAQDGCGRLVECGTCPASSVCFGGACCTPAADPCAGRTCGVVKTCGRSISCGTCSLPERCGADDRCGCEAPNPCGAFTTCGSVTDACQRQVSCGTCDPPLSCGGGDVPGRCGCKPGTPCAGKNCGSAVDGCGETVICGACSGADSCGGGGQPWVCGCLASNPCGAKNCDTAVDACDRRVSCGVCSGADSCGGGGTPGVCGCADPNRCLNRCDVHLDACGRQVDCSAGCLGVARALTESYYANPKIHWVSAGGTPNQYNSPVSVVARWRARSAPAAGAARLYECSQTFPWGRDSAPVYNRFVSRDPACNGRGAVVGGAAASYAFTTARAGTAAVYLCEAAWDPTGVRWNRYVTAAADCAGGRRVGLLGYLVR